MGEVVGRGPGGWPGLGTSGVQRSSHLGGRDPPDLAGWCPPCSWGLGTPLTLLSSWLGTRLPCSQSQLRTPFLQEALLTSWPTTVTSSRAPSPLSALGGLGCRWGHLMAPSWAPSSPQWPGHPEPGWTGLWLPQTTAGCEVCRSLSQGAGGCKGKQEGQWGRGVHLSPWP